MSIPYELNGRTRQKQRTRGALLTAAPELVAKGKTPTVDESATKASLSRTTAYRYFPNQRALLRRPHPAVEARSLPAATAPRDVSALPAPAITHFPRIID